MRVVAAAIYGGTIAEDLRAPGIDLHVRGNVTLSPVGDRIQDTRTLPHNSFLEWCHCKAIGVFTWQIVHFCVPVLVSCVRQATSRLQPFRGDRWRYLRETLVS